MATATTERRPPLDRQDYPLTLRLDDGRSLFVAVPGRMTRLDRDGSVNFTPEAVRLIDRVRALATPLGDRPSPGRWATLREALGQSRGAFAASLEVDETDVAAWEAGTTAADDAAVERAEAIRRRAAGRGVVLDGSAVPA